MTNTTTIQSIYNQAIKTLMRNDRNATWYEIIEESNNDYTEALETLINDLTYIVTVNDNCYDDEELQIYKDVLSTLK